MLQNLDISNTLVALGEFIKNDTDIQSFCEENFTEDLSVYVGDFTRKTIPTAANCPYIVLTDFKKKEGQNIEFCEYHTTAFVGVSVDVLTEDETTSENEETENTETENAENENTENTDDTTDDTNDTNNETDVVVDEDGVLMLDIFDVGAKFMTLIETIFNDKTKRNRPLSRCETDGPYPIDTKHWVGKMELTWRIYQTLGTSYQEEL